MSGIVFLVQNDKTTGFDTISKMAKYLEYRGPDGKRKWVDDKDKRFVAMAQAQLNNTFQSFNEKCPIDYKGRFHIVSDSRIDDREYLISKLKFDFPDLEASDADSKLILYSFLKWGKECTSQLIGDFAFIIWDSVEEEVFAVRNHTGSISLYYYVLPDGIIISNTLNCLKLHPKICFETRDEAYLDYILFRQVWDLEKTTYHNIQRIPPGSTLSWRNKNLRISTFWEPPSVPVGGKIPSKDELYEEYLSILSTAVKDRIQTPKICSMLSGGMDSSSVTSIAKKYLPNESDLTAFCVTHNQIKREDQEGHLTTKLAKSLGIELDLMCGEEFANVNYCNEFDFPEPTLWSQYSTWNAFIHKIKELGGSSTILTGFGADPLLAKPVNHWKRLVSDFKLIHFIRDFFWNLRQDRTIPRVIHKNDIRQLFNREPKCMWEGFLSSETITKYSLLQKQEQIFVDEIRNNRKINRVFWAHLQSVGDPDQLMLPIKIVHPFLDIRVIEFCNRIPVYPYLYKKKILRDVMKESLPNDILTRPKTGIAFDLIQNRTISSQKKHEILNNKALKGFFTPKSNNYLVKNPQYAYIFSTAIGLVNWIHSKGYTNEK